MDYKERDNIVSLVRDQRFMLIEPVIPPNFDITKVQVRAPVINDEIQRLIAQLTINPPAWKVPPASPGPVSLTRSSKMEIASKAIWDRWCKDNGKNLFYHMIDKAVSQGEAILAIRLRLDHWASAPERKTSDTDAGYLTKMDNYKKTAKFPISARVVDRLTYYPRRDEDGLQSVIEVSKRTFSDIRKTFGDKDFSNKILELGLPTSLDAPFTPTSQRNVTLIEYWDREWCVYLMTDGTAAEITNNYYDKRGIVLRAFRHGYDRVPYFDAYGEETADEDQNYSGMPAAYPIMYLAQFYDSLLTMWANIGTLTGYPTIVEEKAPGASDTRGPGTEDDSDEDDAGKPFTPGTLLSGPPGTKYSVLNYGQPAQAINGMIAEIKGLMASAMLPSIMHGIPPGSRTAGYAIQELAAAAKAKYQTTVRNCEAALGEAMNFAFWLIEEKLDQDVYLLTQQQDKNGTKYKGYLEFGPDDINGYYAVECQIQPRNPVDRIQEATYYANMKAAGTATKRMVIEDGMGYEQPDLILDEIKVEEWMDSDEVKQFTTKMAIQKAGLAGFMDDLNAVNQAQQMQAQLAGMLGSGGNGGMGGPGGPTTAGQSGGVMAPGAPAVTAPNMQGMQMPGMPGMNTGMAMNAANGSMGQLPRQYTAKPPAARAKGAGQVPGAARTQPVRPSIEGFRSR